MGVQGTLEYLSDLLSSKKKKKKRKQTQTVALKIRMDCEGCARKVKHVLSGVKGTYFVYFLVCFLKIAVLFMFSTFIVFIEKEQSQWMWT